MMHVGQALERGANSRTVAAKAAEKAASAGGKAADLALVFSTDGYDAREVLAGVREVLDDVPVAGCQAPGVLACGEVTHDGVGVLVCAGGGLNADVVVAEGVSQDSRAAGANLAGDARKSLEGGSAVLDHMSRAVLVLPDAIAGNAAEVMLGLDEELGSLVRIAGGGAGDDLKFARTYQYANAQAYSGAVVGVALRSRSPIGIALRHGCQPWGPPMNVTRASGRVIHELDFNAPFEMYRSAVAQVSMDADAVERESFVQYAMLHPFGIPQGEQSYVLRSPLQLLEGGAIHRCSDLPPGGVMRVMRGDRGSLLAASSEAGRAALGQLGGARCAVGIVFACVSRDFVLGERATHASAELAAVREGLGDVPLFGCLTFGQIGSLSDGASQFHSKSIQVVALAA